MTVNMVIVLQMPITINTRGLSVGANSLYVTSRVVYPIHQIKPFLPYSDSPLRVRMIDLSFDWGF